MHMQGTCTVLSELPVATRKQGSWYHGPDRPSESPDESQLDTPSGHAYSRGMSGSGDFSPELAAQAVDSCACFNVRRTARAVTRHFDDALQAAGLRSTQFVMLVAAHAYGERGLPALAKEMGIDRSALTRRLASLEKAGWVKVTPSPAAGPSRVRLTAKGRRKAERAIPLWEAAQATFEAGLGRTRWSSVLKQLHAAEKAAGGERAPHA